MIASELLRQVPIEIDQNDRLRLGCYFVVSLLLVWIILLTSDEVSKQERKYRERLEVRLDLESHGDEELWLKRFEDERLNYQGLKQNLWEGASENQTLALIQTSLRELTIASEMERFNIRVGTPEWQFEDKGVRRVRTRIGGTFRGDSALKMVSKIEMYSPMLVIESLSIQVDPLRPGLGNRFSIDVLAYYMTGNGVDP